MYKVIVNIRLCIEVPKAKTEQEALDFIENIRFQVTQENNYFDVIRVIKEDYQGLSSSIPK